MSREIAKNKCAHAATTLVLGGIVAWADLVHHHRCRQRDGRGTVRRDVCTWTNGAIRNHRARRVRSIMPTRSIAPSATGSIQSWAASDRQGCSARRQRPLGHRSNLDFQVGATHSSSHRGTCFDGETAHSFPYSSLPLRSGIFPCQVRP